MESNTTNQNTENSQRESFDTNSIGSFQSTEKIISENKPDVHWTDTPPEKPFYLSFLRFIGGLNLFVGLIGFIICFVTIGKLFDNFSYNDSPVLFIIGLIMLLEGSLAFGLLYAIADIAENMLEVGRYVKKLKETPTNK